jgi:hypothetical protein
LHSPFQSRLWPSLRAGWRWAKSSRRRVCLSPCHRPPRYRLRSRPRIGEGKRHCDVGWCISSGGRADAPTPWRAAMVDWESGVVFLRGANDAPHAHRPVVADVRADFPAQSWRCAQCGGVQLRWPIFTCLYCGPARRDGSHCRGAAACARATLALGCVFERAGMSSFPRVELPGCWPAPQTDAGRAFDASWVWRPTTCVVRYLFGGLAPFRGSGRPVRRAECARDGPWRATAITTRYNAFRRSEP